MTAAHHVLVRMGPFTPSRTASLLCTPTGHLVHLEWKDSPDLPAVWYYLEISGVLGSVLPQIYPY